MSPLIQFVWEGNEGLGEGSSIFTGVFCVHYSAPNGFNFDNIWRRNILLEGNPKADQKVSRDDDNSKSWRRNACAKRSRGCFMMAWLHGDSRHDICRLKDEICCWVSWQWNGMCVHARGYTARSQCEICHVKLAVSLLWNSEKYFMFHATTIMPWLTV